MRDAQTFPFEGLVGGAASLIRTVDVLEKYLIAQIETQSTSTFLAAARIGLF
jgi:hypothetical protein